MEEGPQPGEIDRRGLLKRAGLVAGTTVWATPTVQSLTSGAFATGSAAPTGPFTVAFTYVAPTTQGAVGSFVDPDDDDGGGCQPATCADTDGEIPAGSAPSQCVNVPGLGTYCVTVDMFGEDSTSTRASVYIAPPPGAAVGQVTMSARVGDSCRGSTTSGYFDDGRFLKIFSYRERISHVTGCFVALPL